mgnify:CR=1 FL=1
MIKIVVVRLKSSYYDWAAGRQCVVQGMSCPTIINYYYWPEPIDIYFYIIYI